MVATRDRAQRLQNLIEALKRQTLAHDRFELIVVDDGSRDETPSVLAAAAATTDFHVRMERGERRGPAAARNIGWIAGEAPLVAFTDDDCEPDPGWLEAGIEVARANPGCFVQGRTRPIEREWRHGGPRIRTKWIDGPGPWFQTCNMIYPRTLLSELGGFDEAFRRPFGEDVDLGWRALRIGAAATFEPRMVVRHAVEELSPSDYIRSGMRDPDEALVFSRHPELRGTVRRLRFFKSDHHALLPLAIAAGLGARRRPWLLAFVAPYALNLALRTRRAPRGPAEAPLVVLHDSLELIWAVRGALRHRAPII